MKSIAFWLAGLFLPLLSFSQSSFRLIVRDSISQEPISGITVKLAEKNLMAATDTSGAVVFSDLPDGNYHFILSAVNYQPRSIEFRLPDAAVHTVLLQRQNFVLEDVTIISTTRNNQRIENSPLKVEVLGQEDMNEENTIRPANIASILGDVSGIQIQQSSATSGNANVRIQGLDGRYTQILRDGMPLFDGFSGNFGILSIPPLDLRQIELVKGSASTLYGGGAIGGLINLISRRPTAKQEAVLTLNQTTLKESDVNTYLAKRYAHIGYTFLSAYTKQGAADVNNDGFTDVPQLHNFIIHPRLFFYPNANTTIITGYAGTFEKRVGGDLSVVKGKPDNNHVFIERNRTNRHTGEFIAEGKFSEHVRATVKASLSSFDRSIRTHLHYFRGNQLNYFTEASLLLTSEKSDWVTGLNIQGDRFEKRPSDLIPLHDFSNNTIGVFVQNTLRLDTATIIETGVRLDHHNAYGNFFLPRVALFHRFSEQWASRLGVGLGYKTPNALAPQTIEYNIENINPIPSSVHAERSYGFNAELNYKIEFENANTFFINQAFFLTHLSSPLVVLESSSGAVSFFNAAKPLVSKGSDTYVQMDLYGWEVYAGYTFTVAERKYLPSDQFVPLTPRNRFAFTAVKEIGEQWRLGLEGSYTGTQYRDNDTKTPGYFFMAAMIGRNLGKHVSIILNGENLLDYRQSKHETLYTGTMLDPVFKPLWAPIDGRVINLSLRIK